MWIQMFGPKWRADSTGAFIYSQLQQTLFHFPSPVKLLVFISTHHAVVPFNYISLTIVVTGALNEPNCRSGTDLMSMFCCCVAVLFLLEQSLQKSLRLRRFKSDRGWKFGIYWPSRIFDVKSHFQDGSHDVIYADKCYHLVSKHETFAGA